MALLLVLSVVGIIGSTVLLLFLQLIALARLEEQALRRQLLRLSAEQAARRGLAQLQACLGVDTAISFEDSPGRLTSRRSSAKTDTVALAGEAVLERLRLSWNVSDVSLHHDEAAARGGSLTASAWARSAAGLQKLPVGPVRPVLSESARLALQLRDRSAFLGLAGVSDPLGPGWGHFGLLTDGVAGGLRRDLSQNDLAEAEFGRELAAKLVSEPMWRRPAEGVELFAVRSAGRSLVHLPVLADCRLSLGFFNSRSDGRHRLRFHVSGLWWNPSTVPLLANAQGRMFLVEVCGAPEVSVRNLDSGAHFEVNLDECPRLDLGVLQQSEREEGLWFWADVPDRQSYGMRARGLLPGEVFGFVAPSGQSQGLARILTAQTWRYDDATHGTTWRRPSPQTFLPDDRIQIDVRFPETTSLNLRPAGPEPDRLKPISAYPVEPVISLRGIPFPDFQIVTRGSDYSRSDSKGYLISERRACLRLRLRPRSAGELLAAVRSGRIVRTAWDLGLPEDRAEWVVDNPLLSALDDKDYPTGPDDGVLWDPWPGMHGADAPSAFAAVRLCDPPLAPQVSLGFLRHLEDVPAKPWRVLLDQAFLSAPLSVPEGGVVSHHPRIVSASQAGLSSDDLLPGAGAVVISGAFNVNSRSSEAWLSLLSGGQGGWVPDEGGAFKPSPIKDEVLFSLPSGAGTAQWGAGAAANLTDEVMRVMTPTEIRAACLVQSVRAPGVPGLRNLAEKIVEMQPSCGWPFQSLREFAESGLLDRALASARTNEFIPADMGASGLCLRGDDLLEAFAPMLAVRGDTFRITGRSDEIIPGADAGSCELELTVQRAPAPHAMPFLGRRFRIISVRFRNPADPL